MYPYSRLRKIFFGALPDPSQRQIRSLWIALGILTAAVILFGLVLHLLHP